MARKKALQDPFTISIFDKIRAAFAAKKRVFVIDGRKFRLSHAPTKGYILVKPADGSLIPMANIESLALLESRRRSWRAGK